MSLIVDRQIGPMMLGTGTATSYKYIVQKSRSIFRAVLESFEALS